MPYPNDVPNGPPPWLGILIAVLIVLMCCATLEAHRWL